MAHSWHFDVIAPFLNVLTYLLTYLQLLNIMDKWTEYLEVGCQVDVIYTDSEKAFDKVPHQRLLLKLKSYNIHDDILQWISSFLQSRCQWVVLNNSSSDWSPVLSGIPQGTFLGSLLFLIYVSDLPQHCKHYRWILLVLNILKYVTSSTDYTSLQSSLDNLITWSNKWFLKLNTQKCKCFIW